MFSSRCFSSSIKLLSELQVQVLELISGPKDKFPPLLSLNLRQASTQLPEQRPPAAGQPQVTWEIHARLAAWTRINRRPGLLQTGSKPKGTPNRAWHQCSGNWTGFPEQVTAFQLSGMPSKLLPHTATLCPESTEQEIHLFLYKPKQNEWGWLLVLFNDSALRISTELTPWYHMWSFQARAAVHWWGCVENPELPQLSPRVNGGWHTPALSSKHPSKKSTAYMINAKYYVFAVAGVTNPY